MDFIFVQDQREASLLGFREEKYNVLVATDVAGRGIDVPDVALVINYDMPTALDQYTHRIGRTARAGRTGLAVTLLSPQVQHRHTCNFHWCLSWLQHGWPQVQDVWSVAWLSKISEESASYEEVSRRKKVVTIKRAMHGVLLQPVLEQGCFHVGH